MADQSESGRRQPTKDARGLRGSNRSPGESIRAVSGLLASRKALLDRPSGRATVAFPDVSRSFGEIDRRPKDLENRRSEPEGSSISHDPSPVRFPDAGVSDGSSGIDRPPGERPGITSETGDLSPALIGNKGGSIGVDEGVSSSPTPVSLDFRPDGIAFESSKPEPVPRIGSTEAKFVALRGSPALAGAGGTGDRFDEDPAVGSLRRSDPTGDAGEGPSPVRKEAAFSDKAALVDLLRESGARKLTQEPTSFPGLKGFRAMSLNPGVAFDHEPSSVTGIGSSASFVRNPLSSDLGNLSFAGSSPSEETSRFSDRGGEGKGFLDDSFGQATSSQGVAPVDLSKTNELLQQLIDAVRKQRGSSLPVGGPSVYSDR